MRRAMWGAAALVWTACGCGAASENVEERSEHLATALCTYQQKCGGPSGDDACYRDVVTDGASGDEACAGYP